MRRPTSNIFSITPLYPDRNKSNDLFDEKNVYAHEQLFNFNKFMKNRENDLMTIVKRKVKHRKQNYIKSGFPDNPEVLKQLQMKEMSDISNEIEK